MIRIFLPIAAALLPMLLASCGGCGGNKNVLPAHEASWQAAYAPGAAKGIAASTAYKGLAHPRKDMFLYRKQLRTLPHREFGGFMFHQQPVPVAADTLAEVGRIYAEPSNHRARREIKPCPGFHPDWALVWRDGRGEWILQICYGCHEWKLIGPDGPLYTDIADAPYVRLLRLLPRK